MTRGLVIWLVLLLTACGGGSGGSSAIESEQQSVSTTDDGSASANCSPDCFLSASDVEQVIGQAVAEAAARNVNATIAVVDRVGNVLGVYQMNGSAPFVTITSTSELGGPVIGGLESLNFIPATLAAVSKAMTGAYLSTTGNAFTTRTASQIVQENFNPGERDVPSGPLFGVQFSQLPCSDFSTRFTSGLGPGPHRAPLGLSADPGGIPLYLDGVAVGGVGVIADGVYGLDKNISDFDHDLDEIIATAATVGYAAPLGIRADQITIVGKTARFSDSFVEDLITTPSDTRRLDELEVAGVGGLIAVPGYYSGGSTLAGTIFGNPASGIRQADPNIFADANGEPLDAFIFVDETDTNRFPAIDAVDAPGGDVENRLTRADVQTIINEAIGVANQSRAQIRVPVGSQARVTVTVVDTHGTILGMARTRDGPVFGADVSLQKARTATFFSGTGRKDGQAPADLLRSLPAPLYMAPLDEPIDLGQLTTLDNPAPSFPRYVTALQFFLGNPDALESSGSVVAFADRSGGNLSRPHYPDGPANGPPGPLSKPQGQWSIFSDGLQLDLAYNAIINHVAFVLGAAPEVPQNCTGNTGFSESSPFTAANAIGNLANGIQIFPGSVPVFRGNILIGGVGVSGDGVDQDDMISFLGVHRAGVRLGSEVAQGSRAALGNAPPELRADRLVIPGQSSRLRYVNCPQLPFIDSDETEVCDGL
jgi:uncharacterized protein GlcG (DUF336 family)